MIHLLTITALLTLGACAAQPEPTAEPAAVEQSPETNPEPEFSARDSNLLDNPSFEDTTESPWFNYAERTANWAPFAIVDGGYRSDHAALLDLDSDDPQQPSQRIIHGVVQETPAPAFPRYISGAYKVDQWERGTANQYLQLVVIVWNATTLPKGFNLPNYQIAVPLAGIARPPFRMLNRKFVMGCPAEPTVAEWVEFEYDIQLLFEREWGLTPSDYEYLRVFFEVRYDGRADHEPRALAHVRFDDLYLGPDARDDTESSGESDPRSDP